jgi:hypothetical protein
MKKADILDWAPITKYCTLGVLSTTEISHSSGGWKAKIRVPTWPGPDQSGLLCCRLMSTCCVLTWHMVVEGTQVLIGPLYKGTNAIQESPALIDPLPNTVTLGL